MYLYFAIKGGEEEMKRIEMVGNKYGHLTVTKMLPNYNNSKKTYCLCDCDCGNKDIVRNAWDLRNRTSELSSCGCTIKEKVRKVCGREIDGERFGRLTILETYWDLTPPKVKCKCDCGKTVVLSKNDVQCGHTQSCGCLNKEIVSNYFTKDWSGYISESGVEITKPLYQNDKQQWMWECICPLCGKLFVALPIKIADNHTTSCGCKRESSGERIIETILNDMNLDYKKQYSFDDCKYKYKLRFDFAVILNNGLLFLIEYDGIQHFKPISVFGGQAAFDETQIRDGIKSKYCKDNSISLLRINYKQSVDEIKNTINEYIASLTTAGGVWQQAS